jgi:hypothetical protein
MDETPPIGVEINEEGMPTCATQGMPVEGGRGS